MILRSLIVLILSLAALVACRFSPEISSSQETGVVMRLPSGTGRFIGDPEQMDEEEKKLLPSDTEMVKMRYRTATQDDARRDTARVSIVLAGSERRSIHRPEVCLQGQGWRLVDSRTTPVRISADHAFEMRDLLIEKPVRLKDGTQKNLRAHYVYWFVGADVTTPSHLSRTLMSLWDSAFRNVNHRWAYPSVMAYVTENFEPAEIGERKRNSEETRALILELVKQLAPEFQKECMSHKASRKEVAQKP
jgi:uncharacterized protein YcfL